MEDEIIRTFLPALGGAGVTGGFGYLLLGTWLKRAEERFKEVHELRGTVGTLRLQVHNLENAGGIARQDMKDGLKALGEAIDKIDQKFDGLMLRLFTARRDE